MASSVLNRLKHLERPILISALTLSVIANVSLAAVVRTRVKPREHSLVTGRKVDHLTLKTLSGDPVTVSFRNQAEASVVYFTSASCRWCDDNLRYFSTLASAAADNHRLVIITDDSLTAGGPRPDLKGYETFVAAPDTLKEYQLDGVPQLVIIDRTGAVRGSWTGPWSNETVGEIQRLLMVKS